jgi:8-oxo-dGTP pyrophosphatase MutT (NUDIX family)
MADMLCQMTGDGGKHVFGLTSADEDGTCLTLSGDIPANCEARTEAVMSIMKQLATDGVVTGWRDELYPVTQGFYEPPTLLVERAAAPFLGCMEYGIHVNGIVGGSNKDEPKMWIARRSKTKSKWPGMLDHVVAGGQPSGLGLMENVIKECYEEAGIPEAVTRECVRAGGAISYETFSSRQGVIGRAVLFCYELYLPNDFEPKPVDGEVDEFFLWTMDQVKASLSPDFPDPIKPNCYPVIIDYLLRANHVSPETPGYLDVLRELRGGDCR